MGALRRFPDPLDNIEIWRVLNGLMAEKLILVKMMNLIPTGQIEQGAAVIGCMTSASMEQIKRILRHE